MLFHLSLLSQFNALSARFCFGCYGFMAVLAQGGLCSAGKFNSTPVVCDPLLCLAGTISDAELTAPATTEVAKNPGPRIVYPSVSALPRIYRSVANPPSSSFPHQPRAPPSGIHLVVHVWLVQPICLLPASCSLRMLHVHVGVAAVLLYLLSHCLDTNCTCNTHVLTSQSCSYAIDVSTHASWSAACQCACLRLHAQLHWTAYYALVLAAFAISAAAHHLCYNCFSCQYTCHACISLL